MQVTSFVAVIPSFCTQLRTSYAIQLIVMS